MKRYHPLLIAMLVLALTLPLLGGGCATESTSKLKVVTSTSLIAQVVEQVGGDKVDVVNIIPPAQCPGHFDVTPGDIRKLADAELFLLHGWNGEMFSDELIASAGNTELASYQVDAAVGDNDNWMTPPVQAAAVDSVVEILCQADEANCAYYEDAAQDYKDAISAEDTALQARLAAIDTASVNVLCSNKLEGLVKWAGFNIVAMYGRPDSLTPQVVRELVDEGRDGGVTLIIDNMQSGADAGAGLAEELGCARVTLSNFPGGYDNTETWAETIEYNVDLIEDALNR
jgi:zinc transport system substrate-binding protein